MVQLLSKILLLFFIFSCSEYFCQRDNSVYNDKDYKNKEQFEKYLKRRKIVGNWQINQLKTGALVIKLKTNKKLIEQLTKSGNTKLAESKTLENAIVNKCIMMAFKDKFTFCKLYFMFSHFNDSLLAGVRKGIFLDSNLVIDPTIEMTEKFYIIGEKDRAYNSSIGFVPEDSARFAREKGNSTGVEFVAVLKNKYGHQLKKPFPYVCASGIYLNLAYVKSVPINYFEEGDKYKIIIDKTQLLDYKNSVKKQFKRQIPGSKVFMLSRENTYEIIAKSVEGFNDDLLGFYQANPPVTKDRMPEEIFPFLY